MRQWIGTTLVGVTLAMAVGITTVEAQKEKKVKRDSYVITAEEIAEKRDVTNAEEAIQRLRPQWLRAARSKGSMGSAALGSDAYRPAAKQTGSEDNPKGDLDATASSANSRRSERMSEQAGKEAGLVFYLDDVKQPSMDDLRNVRVAEIAEIRFMTGTQATSRYGDGHASGAVLLKTNRLGGN